MPGKYQDGVRLPLANEHSLQPKIQFNLPVDSSNPVNVTVKMEGKGKGLGW